MSVLNKFAALCLAFVMMGCSAFHGHDQPLTVVTEPAGAEISIDDEYISQSPLTHKVRRNRDHVIVARLEGYRSSSRKVTCSWNETAKLDFIGGLFMFFPAWIGLLMPGAKSLDDQTVIFHLQKQ